MYTVLYARSFALGQGQGQGQTRQMLWPAQGRTVVKNCLFILGHNDTRTIIGRYSCSRDLQLKYEISVLFSFVDRR
jgi:hypothetical protein